MEGWKLGDGTTATGASVEHSYSKPGAYHLSVKVTDKAGKKAKATFKVRVKKGKKKRKK